MSQAGKNEEAWQRLFEKYDILPHIEAKGFFNISASQINEFREARLMAKNDTKEALPKLFRQHQLNINAVSNGLYILFEDPEHKSFLKLPDFKELVPEPFYPNFPFSLDTLEFSPQMAESKAIDFAHFAGLLQHYFDEKELVLTTRGRTFSDAFEIELGEKIGRIPVDRVQIEVDAGYEGASQFIILEAKSSTRNSFNIRQLYYPLQHFKKRTSKEIRTVLLSFSNGVYYFTEVAFGETYYDYRILNNRALELVLEQEPVRKSIDELLSQPSCSTAGVPVPQADDLNKVVDVVSILNTRPSDKYELAARFDFADRQGDYYGNAAVWLGLAEKKNGQFSISQRGKQLIGVRNRDKRNELLLEAILKTTLFNSLLRLYLQQQGSLADEQIIEQISAAGYNSTTAARRTSTIKAWLRWVQLNYLQGRLF